MDDSDSGWLKKNPMGNPFRRSLRSSRFYPKSPSMDTSIQATDSNKTHKMAVPFIPKRSNVPKETLRRLSFKVPAPMREKNPPKKVTGVPSRASMGSFLRPPQVPCSSISSSSLKVNKNKSTVPKEKIPIPFPVFGPRSSMYIPNGSIKRPMKPNIVERMVKLAESGKKLMESSALNSSALQAHSTPNVPRSILKQSQLSSCKLKSDLVSPHNESVLSSKPKAAKRVNFDGVRRNILNEKENEKKNVNELEAVKEFNVPKTVVSHELNLEPLDESTIVFKNSFKPIEFDDIPPKKPMEFKAPEVKDVSNGKFVTNPEFSTKKKSKAGNEILKHWNQYISEVNEVHKELESLDVKFSEDMNDLLDYENFSEMFLVYATKEDELFDRLIKLREAFGAKTKSTKDKIKSAFLEYRQEKMNKLESMKFLDRQFETNMTIIWTHNESDTQQSETEEKKKGRSSFRRKAETPEKNEKEEDKTKIQTLSAKRRVRTPKSLQKRRESSKFIKEKESPINKFKKVTERSKQVKKNTSDSKMARRKSLILQDLQKSLKLCSPGSESDNSNADNTPSRRRRLSRKIQNQLDTLFESE